MSNWHAMSQHPQRVIDNTARIVKNDFQFLKIGEQMFWAFLNSFVNNSFLCRPLFLATFLWQSALARDMRFRGGLESSRRQQACKPRSHISIFIDPSFAVFLLFSDNGQWQERRGSWHQRRRRRQGRQSLDTTAQLACVGLMSIMMV